MNVSDNNNEHDKFKELAALATVNLLTIGEWAQLTNHALVCRECEEVYHQYRNLATEAIPLLAFQYNNREAQENWNDASLRKKIFNRIKVHQVSSGQGNEAQVTSSSNIVFRILKGSFVPVYVAAAFCIVAAVGFAAYRLGSQKQVVAAQLPSSPGNVLKDSERNKSLDEVNRMLDSRTKRTLELEEESSRKQQELTKLKSDLQSQKDRVSELVTAISVPEEQLQDVTKQREALAVQLQDAQRAYNDIQVELTALRIERDEALSRSGLLESKLKEVSTTTRDQQERLAEYEQYMASDRDIRELMGARKLYIADVFDVDRDSHTQQAYGRIFYTEGKSLIFYAFDLEDKNGRTKASAFQVWGKSENVGKPVNLGILYMDNASNRRWLLRVDDPEELARINAVFVTVEPHGGSQKPTSKPFLYALLRQQANHP